MSGNIEEQLTHFQHGSTVGDHDEEMELQFPRSVYGEIGDKDIGSFHSAGRCWHEMFHPFEKCQSVSGTVSEPISRVLIDV